MQWETVIGLEIHIQLATDSKLFSSSCAHFGASPNTQASLYDLAMPGTLPVLNEKVLALAIQFGTAINAHINTTTLFARKNYFYPDLPKGYQITQMDRPIVENGTIDIQTSEGNKTIHVERAHLEEDAGKSVHDLFLNETAVDLNRAGVPLLEIVSAPDMRSAEEAVAYLKKVHQLIRYLKISDGNMAEGSMRCDVNISLRPLGQTTLGTRAELKNINSFRFVEKAIAVEVARQQSILEAGGTIVQETRLYDADKNETRSMRSKESAQDYRYFLEPDLLPVQLSDAFVVQAKSSMPELPAVKCKRLMDECGIAEKEAQVLTAELEIALFFEAVIQRGVNPKTACNWVISEWMGYLNKENIAPIDSSIRPDDLGDLIKRIEDGTLSGKMAKEVFKALAQSTGQNVDTIIEAKGLKQMTSLDDLKPVVEKILSDHPEQVAQYIESDESKRPRLLGFFVGQAMKATAGSANPKQINALLQEALQAAEEK